MPLGPGVRYRYKKGTSIRLALRGNRVVEVKNMATGALHRVIANIRKKKYRRH